VAPIIATRHAKHRAVVAEVDVAAPAEIAFAARHGRVERDAIAGLEAVDRATCPLDDAGGFVSHDERRNAPPCRSVVAVDVAAADAARPHTHEHVLVTDLGHGHIDN
jgi:hypothetical protein